MFEDVWCGRKECYWNRKGKCHLVGDLMIDSDGLCESFEPKEEDNDKVFKF